MADRKLQVFVSSTYLDLKEERQAAVEAILLAGHIPAGMELFSAGSESQWETIKRWIDESDLLLLILGERYGSLEPKSKKSYTQMEYEYAESIGKPVFALVLDKTWIDQKYRSLGTNASDDYRTQHHEFKDHVLRKLCAMVADVKDIKLQVQTSMSNFARDKSLSGWVRADAYASSQVLVEELTKSLSDLRNSKSGPPTKDELDNRFRSHFNDLSTIIDEFEVNLDYRGNKVVFYGSALDFLATYQKAARTAHMELSDKYNTDPTDKIRYSTSTITEALITASSYSNLRLDTMFEVWGLGLPNHPTWLGQDFLRFVRNNYQPETSECWKRISIS